MKTLRLKQPFAALHLDCFRDYIDNGLVKTSGKTSLHSIGSVCVHALGSLYALQENTSQQNCLWSS